MGTNPHQRGQTHNALSLMIDLVKKRINKFEEGRKYLIEGEITYMEKFDGTNIAKDRNVCIYTRRTKLNQYVKEYIGTSLQNVQQFGAGS